MEDFSSELQQVTHWPFLPVLTRLCLAVAIGVFVGLEREHSGKAGVRTFALTSLLGSAAGISGGFYPAASLSFTALIVAFLNARSPSDADQNGHDDVNGAHPGGGLRDPLRGRPYFYTGSNGSHHRGLARVEAADFRFCRWLNRSGGPIGDPVRRSHLYHLPSAAIASSGSVGFSRASVKLGERHYHSRDRLRELHLDEVAGSARHGNHCFFRRLGQQPKGGGRTYRPDASGRFGFELLCLPRYHVGHCCDDFEKRVDRAHLRFASGRTVRSSSTLMLLISILLWIRNPPPSGSDAPASISLESPFQLSAALKFGLVFLALNVIGGLAQRNFGSGSFYFVSIAGGLLSSASSIASAATLISHHEISASTGVNGVVLSSLTSILINIPLMRSITKEAPFRRKVNFALIVVAATGLIGAGLNVLMFELIPKVIARV